MTEEASNTDRKQSWSDSPSKHGDTYHDSAIPLRSKPVSDFYFQKNEFTDIFAPIIGPFAAMVYEALCRDSYGKHNVEYSVRDLAHGMSAASVARAIEILEAVGLIKRLPTSETGKAFANS